MASRIEELRAQLAAATADATASALTDEERAEADLLAQIEAQREAAAAADATRRASDMAARVAVAEQKAGAKYLVQGVDLVALFPLGKAPPAGHLPGRGVIVVRSPKPEAVDDLNREVEAKKLPVARIMADLLCASTVDPDPTTTDGITLRGFCEAYPDAASQAAQQARELGGAKARADKRGRT